MKEIARDMEEAIDEIALAEETYRVGENNIQGLINGTASMRCQLIEEYREMGREAMSAYQREVGQASPSKKFKRIGQYDIQGIIQGAEAEKPKLAAYEEAVRLMVAGRGRETSPIQIYIDRMEIRDESDVERVARELYLMAAQESRLRGGRVMSGFLFRGVHSSKFGISTQDQNRTILPPRREGKITIPGRSWYYGGVNGIITCRSPLAGRPRSR